MPWGRNKPPRPKYPQHFPDVVAALDEAEIGGDPARFLCYGDTHLTRARIQGIADEPTVRAWIGVANELRRRGRLDELDHINVVGALTRRLEAIEDRPGETVVRPVALDVVRAKRQRDREERASASAKLADLRTDGGDDAVECFRCGVDTPEADVDPFDLPDGESVALCPACRERWEGRTFIVGGASP